MGGLLAIYPPVDTDRFSPSEGVGEYYLAVFALFRQRVYSNSAVERLGSL
jgi:hypothetical protein